MALARILVEADSRSRPFQCQFSASARTETASRAILLVEPDDDTRTIYRTALEHAGYRVIAAENGQEGVDLALRWRPDLVLTELFNPHIDGYGVREALAAHAHTSQIPVLAVTTCHMPGARKKTAALGFAGYWTKPMAPAALVEKVRQIFGSAEAGGVNRSGA